VYGGADPWALLAAGGSIPDLPPGTSRKLLEAVSRLRPFGPFDPEARQWVLAEPGHQYLVCARSGAPLQLDLSADPATFTARRIDSRTGQVGPPNETLQGGRVVDLPGTGVFWLRAETESEAPSSP